MKNLFSTWTAAKWVKEVRREDDLMKDPSSSDLVIGYGSHRFINTLFGQENLASVSHGLKSHTSLVQAYPLADPEFPNNRIVIVDTPGFDDTYLSDREILSRISVWLAHSYQANMKLAGIIYLYDISHTRWEGSMRRNFEVFEKLCGPVASRKVVLVTTMWDKVKPDEGEMRERELRSEYWDKMLADGSVIHRAGISGDQASAQDTVDYLLAKEAYYPLQIQRELVEINKTLQETEAGRHLSQMLKDSLRKYEDKASKLRSMARANPGSDPELIKDVLETNDKILDILRQINALKVPLTRKVQLLFTR
ncbi:hypothetical protein DXG01_011228 [Tephrocybe rancida]|nr:hypothetical protein DXG01_011228 [Tephrocybe rancida]